MLDLPILRVQIVKLLAEILVHARTSKATNTAPGEGRTCADLQKATAASYER
jgi:hypothetical protein